MGKSNVIRVRPVSFDTDWQADMKSIGVKVPKTVPETRYTPVNHDPIPYSIAVDLTARRVVRRIVGIIPNATYNGRIYPWDEFCQMLGAKSDNENAGTSQTRLYERDDS